MLPSPAHPDVPAVFPSPELDEQFRLDGFVHVPGFLGAGELTEMEQIFKTVDSGHPGPFYTSFEAPDASYRARVNSLVGPVLATALHRLAPEYDPFAAGFLVKHPSRDGGEVPVHQDTTFNDESKDPVVILWIPLRDMRHEDGPLTVVPGSHRFWRSIQTKGPEGPVSPIEGHQQFLFDRFAVEILARAGDAVLYDPRTFHASTRNFSDRVRVAAGAVTARRTDQLLHFFPKAGGALDVYEVGRDFYWRDYWPGRRPEGGAKLRETIPYRSPTFTRDELAAMCERAVAEWKQRRAARG